MLVTAVFGIVDRSTNIYDRRKATLELLVEMLDADKGHWAWGGGASTGKVTTPLGTVMVGYEDDERAEFLRMSTDPRMDHEFRRLIVLRMNGANQNTVSKSELMTTKQWKSTHIRECFQRMGLNSWLHSIRFQQADLWSNMMVVRGSGKAEFTPADSAFLDFAMESVPFLHATANSTASSQRFEQLTPRQRTVLTLLLDGSPRKKIAATLAVSSETVNDHITAIYRVFEVNSSIELAAIFLRRA